MTKTSVFIIIILILLAGNVYFGFRYLDIQKELAQTEETLKTQQINASVLDFAKLFVNSVLKAQNEIDFETRLKLENAVRNLNDEEILAQWQKFTGSENESRAQAEVKNLLEMLINKIVVK